MKDYNIPIADLSDQDSAEIILKIKNKKSACHYRIESFQWEQDGEFPNDDQVTWELVRISRLKKAIRDYDKNWELIQIYTPSTDSNSIQVLYRKKS